MWPKGRSGWNLTKTQALQNLLFLRPYQSSLVVAIINVPRIKRISKYLEVRKHFTLEGVHLTGRSNWKLNIPFFIFLIWLEQFWFSQKLTKKTSVFWLFFKVTLILPPVRLSNLGSDLSIDNKVWLDSADTKTASQDAVNKMVELTEKVNSKFFRNLLETWYFIAIAWHPWF